MKKYIKLKKILIIILFMNIAPMCGLINISFNDIYAAPPTMGIPDSDGGGSGGSSPSVSNPWFDEDFAPPTGSVDLGGVSGDFSKEDGFSSIIQGLDGLNSQAATIHEGFTDLTNVFKRLSTMSKIVSVSLSAVTIAIIGLKLMNSSSTNAAQFLKGKKELQNAIMVIFFMFSIPYTIGAIKEFKMPTFVASYDGENYYIDSASNSTGIRIDQLAVYPKSDLKSLLEIPPSVSVPELDDDTKMDFGNTIINLIMDAINAILRYLLYWPFRFLVILLGIVSLFPVSFDPEIYGTTIFDNMIKKYIINPEKPEGIGGFSITEDIVATMSSAMVRITNACNFVYFFSKSICFLALEVVCYIYAIMVFLGSTREHVGTFIKKIFTAAFGMVLIPPIIQFLLDIDAIFSASLLKVVGGDGVPGLSLLSLLPTMDESATSLVILILGFIIAVAIMVLSKSFFIRRIEIMLYYMIAPFIMLGHIIPTQSDPLREWSKKMISAIFLTTVYSPIFMIIWILLNSGNTTETQSVLDLTFYYLMVVSIIWFGKNIITSIFDMFGHSFMSSEASKLSRDKLRALNAKDALNIATSGGKLLAGGTAFAATGVKGLVTGVGKAAEMAGNVSGNYQRFKDENPNGNALNFVGDAIRRKASQSLNRVRRGASHLNPVNHYRVGQAYNSGDEDVQEFIDNNHNEAIENSRDIPRLQREYDYKDEVTKRMEAYQQANNARQIDSYFEPIKEDTEEMCTHTDSQGNSHNEKITTYSHNGVSICSKDIKDFDELNNFKEKSDKYTSERAHYMSLIQYKQKELKGMINNKNSTASDTARVEKELCTLQTAFDMKNEELNELYNKTALSINQEKLLNNKETRDVASDFNNAIASSNTITSKLDSENYSNNVNNDNTVVDAELNQALKYLSENTSLYNISSTEMDEVFSYNNDTNQYSINGNEDAKDKVQKFISEIQPKLAQAMSEQSIYSTEQKTTIQNASPEDLSNVLSEIASNTLKEAQKDIMNTEKEGKKLQTKQDASEVEKEQISRRFKKQMYAIYKAEAEREQNTRRRIFKG